MYCYNCSSKNNIQYADGYSVSYVLFAFDEEILQEYLHDTLVSFLSCDWELL